MNKIIMPKQSGVGIREGGEAVRISTEVDEEFGKISEETGYTKARIANFLLKQALAMVEIVEVESEI